MQNFDLPIVRGEYRHNFSLKQTTWFKVGGNAEVFFKPEDIEDLIDFIQQIDKKVPITILGNCSNVIIRDGGIDGVVIKLGRNFVNMNLDDDFIRVGAGALNSSVATYALQNSRSGIAFLVGIPGTIGGGIRMNAGAYGIEFKDILHSFKAIDFSGKIHEFEADESLFSYRDCHLPEELIFIEATLKTSKGNPDEIKAKINEINEQRSNSQPIKEKTGGSTFANPAGQNLGSKRAWQLIDEAGMRGYRIGGAIFSEKHCNFMINIDDATAKNLEDLGALAIQKVKEKSGVELKWEIKRLGKYE